MNATRLHWPDGRPTTVYACGKCGALRDLSGAALGPGGGKPEFSKEERLEWLRKAVERCCNYKCERCGADARQFYDFCDKCQTDNWRRRSADQEAERYAKAKPDPAHDGPVFLPDSDRAFKSLDDFYEEYGDDADDPDFAWPAYVWCATVTTVKDVIDADRVVESFASDWPEEATDQIGRADVKELQSLLDGWAERQTAAVYEPDYKRYVPVKPPVPHPNAVGEGRDRG